MNDYQEQVHRTWVQLLVEYNYRDVAAIAMESDLQFVYEQVGASEYELTHILFDIPMGVYSLVNDDEHTKKLMKRAILRVLRGREQFDEDSLQFVYRVKLMDVEDGWKNVVRNLIANAQDPNQGVVTEKVFLRNNRQPYTYNEMKFGSQSEIRIAQEFESRGILFFPLPLAVRAETGTFYKDHREVDFLICQDGTWGILEVSYHPDRYEQDSEKTTWFKKSGILCIEHYTAERCHQNASEVVDEFLEILAKHKRH